MARLSILNVFYQHSLFFAPAVLESFAPGFSLFSAALSFKFKVLSFKKIRPFSVPNVPVSFSPEFPLS
jgi:hypothetical protein